MFFRSLYSSQSPVLSLELFPPKESDKLGATLQTIGDLGSLKPHFMTVTYGAGGGTKSLTCQLVSHIKNQLGIPAVAHLTCLQHTVAELEELLDLYESHGVRNILALRGDAPKDSGQTTSEQGSEGEGYRHASFPNARDFVAHIRKTRPNHSIAVAGYPEVHRDARSPESDLAYLREKIDAGGEVIVTQLFFDNSHYFRFVRRAREVGITAPIVPGIMPISSVAQLTRFNTMCGASIPESLLKELDRFSFNPNDIVKFGTAFAVRQCEELLAGGAPGVHLYTLNKSTQVRPIIEALGIGVVKEKKEKEPREDAGRNRPGRHVS